ncbi:MAG: IS1182 family transposase [candidate division NC10 bacterium]|nr:IS1182 family transposase [candidate division NC10 bacterium]
MEKTYRPYDPDQLFLLPPALQDWLPEEHLVHFLSDLVDHLDLSAITQGYEEELRGYPPYHPRMMTKLLLYAYTIGVPSSRRIAQRCQEDVAFRVLTANQTPDFRTISDFRKRHLAALHALFVQVLRCCQRAGLVKLGTIALDGTKVRANASKHKAMSYGRMQTEVARLEAGVEQLLAQAEATDAAEDARYGVGRRGDELPAELARRETRLATIRAAMAALEAEAQAAASDPPPRRRGRPPKTPPGTPSRTAQRNFTDPDSRIMRDADKAFIQATNAQVAVEERSQVVVACAVTNQAADAPHAVPLVDAVRAHTRRRPRRVLADAGYWSTANAAALAWRKIDAYLATEKVKHSSPPAPAPRGRIPQGLGPRDRMQRKLRTHRGRALYARRKAIAEPVFGLIKRARGFRQFLLRGLAKVQAEWALICTGHNLLKLYRSGRWTAA